MAFVPSEYRLCHKSSFFHLASEILSSVSTIHLRVCPAICILLDVPQVISPEEAAPGCG